MRLIARCYQATPASCLIGALWLATAIFCTGCKPQSNKDTPSAPRPSLPGVDAKAPAPAAKQDAEYVVLADDAALEKYLADRTRVRFCPMDYRDGHIVASGTRAVRGNLLSGHLVLWNLEAPPDAGDKAFRILLPPELAGGADPDDITTDGYSTISNDGRWMLWMRTPATGRTIADFWRLPMDIHGKLEKFGDADPVQIAGGDVTLDSRWMLSLFRDKPHLVHVDADAGRIETIPLSMPALQPWLEKDASLTPPQVRFAGPGLTVTVRTFPRTASVQTPSAIGIGVIEVSADGAGATLRSVNWVTREASTERSVVALSETGTLLFVHDGRTARVWRLPAGANQAAQEVCKFPMSVPDTDVAAAWSRDERLLAVQHHSQIDLYDVASLSDTARPARIISLPQSGKASDLKFSNDGRQLVALLSSAAVICRLDTPWPVRASIGGAKIDFEDVPDEPGIAAWPALHYTHEFKIGMTQDPRPAGNATLTLHVRNDGTGPAYQAKFQLHGSPAPGRSPQDAPRTDAIGNGEPDDAQPTPIATIHLGKIAPGQVVSRTVGIPWPADLVRKARRLTLIAQEQHGFAPPPVHWLYLPRTIETEDEYHAEARRVFDAGVKILETLRGRPFAPVITLDPMSEGQFGFTASSSNDRVSYQNLFKMGDYALKVNRTVMQVTTRDDLMRHGQMMLYWYLPHEITHNADGARGWETEFIANMIQPYLTARILRQIPDSPYSAEAMAAVYDRYVQVLRPQISDDDLARIERFIQDDGVGAPFKESARTVFEGNTPAYVYFGARINQHSWAMQSTLEKMFARYVTNRKPQGR